MSGWLLDTNVLSELNRVRPEPKVVAFIAAQPLDELFKPNLIIAATALQYGLSVVSRDSRDYVRARVRLLNPWEETSHNAS